MGGITCSRCKYVVKVLAENHAWHSPSAYLINSSGSLSIPLNSLSFLTFQKYQIIHGYGYIHFRILDTTLLPEKIILISVYAGKKEYITDETELLLEPMHEVPLNIQRSYELQSHLVPHIRDKYYHIVYVDVLNCSW